MPVGYDEPEPKEEATGIRTLMIGGYSFGAWWYSAEAHKTYKKHGSAAAYLQELGVLCMYGSKHPSTKQRKTMEVDEMVKRWHRVVLGLAMAHDKDAADRHEAAVEECLQPILAAPVKQLREFAPKLLAALKGDPQCPFIIWRAYEVWVDMIKEAPNDGIKELKKDLARQIVEMVEEDVKPQVGEAMVRALMWRSPEALEKVKASVEKGNKPRLRGRESCLFLELGGTEQEPEVCVQL